MAAQGTGAEAAQTAAPAPILSVRNLEVSFPGPDGPLQVLCGVSFDLLPGRSLGLVGESGCGKTVTGLALLRLLPNATLKGRILLDGEDLLQASEKRLQQVRGGRIAMVFQEPLTALNPVMTVGSQVAEVARIHRGMARRRAWREAVSLLERVGLPEPARTAKRYPHELSGGMRQRVLVAMALAGSPSVLVADEPTTALDVLVQAEILDLLRQVQRDTGMAMLFVTHDLAVAAQVCDEILVLYSGLVAEWGPVGELLSRPTHPYAQALLDCLPERAEPGKPLPELPGQLPSPSDRPPGCPFHPRCARADETCRTHRPELSQLAPDHAVACHHPLV